MTRKDEMRDVIDKIEDEAEDDDLEYERPLAPKQPSQVYSIRIPVEAIEKLRSAAARHHTTPSALMRSIVLEHLAEEDGAVPHGHIGLNLMYTRFGIGAAGVMAPAQAKRVLAQATQRCAAA